MIRLGLEPMTPNDIGGSRPAIGGLFCIRLAEIFDMALGNPLGKMLMMLMVDDMEEERF